MLTWEECACNLCSIDQQEMQMSTHKESLDRKGCRWVLVSETRSGMYAWFRPVRHANDGHYDRNFRIADMLLICEVSL